MQASAPSLALSCREPEIVLAPSSPRMLINPITSHAKPESLSLFEIGKRLIRCKRPQRAGSLPAIDFDYGHQTYHRE